MLCRPARLGYLAVFFVFIYTWTHYNARSREAINHGWDATVQKFGQGSSFAEDSSHASPTNTALTQFYEPTATVTGSLKPISTVQRTSLSLPQKTELAVEKIFQQPDPYAYVFYATQDLYACSVLVNIERLQTTLKTKHRIFVLATDEISEPYLKALEARNVTVSVQKAPPLASGGPYYYAGCLLKLYGFRMHEIDPSLKRVVVLDSDQLVMKNLDYLFEGFEHLDFDLAAPHAYWISKETFSSAFLLINLSDRLWAKINNAILTVQTDKMDMDIVNDQLGSTVMLLPGHFVALNSHWEDWNLPNWYHGLDTRNGTSHNNKTDISHSTSVMAETTSTKTLAGQMTKVTSVKDLNKRQVPSPDSAVEAHAQIMDAIKHKANPQRIPGSAELNTVAAGNVPTPHNAAVNKAEAHKPASEAPASPPVGLDSIVPITGAPKINSEELYDGRDRLLQTPSTIVDDAFDSRPDPSTFVLPPSPDALYINSFAKDKPVPLVINPKDRPLYHELFDLVNEVSVLHFTAFGKPWTYTVADVESSRPEAHPVFAEQFGIWRQTALAVCPEDIDAV